MGDVEKLSFPDASFDTLLSLNVVVHFPHWRKLLPEWKRVVRPGGRIVFDVHSLDNYRCAYGEGVTEQGLLQQVEQSGDFSTYVLRVAAEDMVAEADKLGLRDLSRIFTFQEMKQIISAQINLILIFR